MWPYVFQLPCGSWREPGGSGCQPQAGARQVAKSGTRWYGPGWKSGAACFATCVAPEEAGLPIHRVEPSLSSCLRARQAQIMERTPAHHCDVTWHDGGGSKCGLHATDRVRPPFFWMRGRLRQSSQIGSTLYCTLDRVATVNDIVGGRCVWGNRSTGHACFMCGDQGMPRLAAGNRLGTRHTATAETRRFKSLTRPYYDQATCQGGAAQ